MIANYLHSLRTRRFAENNEIVMLGSRAWYDHSIPSEKIRNLGNLLRLRTFLLSFKIRQLPEAGCPQS